MLHASSKLGILGELKAAAEFVRLGYTTYFPFSDGYDPFDFIAYKDDKLIRVQVKSTSTQYKDRINGAYEIRLQYKKYYYNKKGAHKRVAFDKEKCDILAVYIKQLDKLCFLNCKTDLEDTKSSISFRETPTKHAHNGKQWVITNYENLEEIIKSLS